MKKLLVSVFLAVLGMAAIIQAQPDPRDSVILESKTIQAGQTGGGIVRVKVYITNKDSLVHLSLILTQVNQGGTMVLSYPRNFPGVVQPLTNTLRYTPALNLTDYPSRFKIAASYDPYYPGSVEPPRAVRKAIWELKFDSVYSDTGTVLFDSTTLVTKTGFTNTDFASLPVNFLAGTITIEKTKGDMDLDGVLSSSDAISLLEFVYYGTVPPAGAAACDLNCDGEAAPADLVLELLAVYRGRPFPC